MRLRELIRKARKVDSEGECERTFQYIERLGTLAKVKKHKNAGIWALWYAENVIKGFWPEGESIIISNPESAFKYAFMSYATKVLDGEPVGPLTVQIDTTGIENSGFEKA